MPHGAWRASSRHLPIRSLGNGHPLPHPAARATADSRRHAMMTPGAGGVATAAGTAGGAPETGFRARFFLCRRRFCDRRQGNVPYVMTTLSFGAPGCRSSRRPAAGVPRQQVTGRRERKRRIPAATANHRGVQACSVRQHSIHPGHCTATSPTAPVSGGVLTAPLGHRPALPGHGGPEPSTDRAVPAAALRRIRRTASRARNPRHPERTTP